MHFLSYLSVALSLAGTLRAATTPQCVDGKMVARTFIGEKKDVAVEARSCTSNVTAAPPEARDALLQRQDDASGPVNVCGAQCNTNCFHPQGGGPDPNECQVIADALSYDSENIGNIFTLSSSGNTATISMQYKSCKTFITKQVDYDLEYCRTDWSSLVNYVAFYCQAGPQDAHGGNCVAADQRWFVQIQSSSG